MPGPSAWPVLAAAFTAGFFLLLTVQAYGPALVSGLLAIALVLRWLWETDGPMAAETVDVGAGVRVPTYVTGPASHGWWAMMVLLVVTGMIFLMAVFSYVFLWSRRPDLWISPPGPVWTALAVAGYTLSGGSALAAGRRVRRGASGPPTAAGLIALAATLGAAAFAADAGSWWMSGLRPDASSQGATVFTFLSFQGVLLAVILVMAGYVAARAVRGLISTTRTSTVDLVALFIGYAAGQGMLSTLLVRLFPGGV